MRALFLAVFALVLAACGGSSGAADGPDRDRFGYRVGSDPNRETMLIRPLSDSTRYLVYPAVVDSIAVRPAGRPLPGDGVAVEVLVQGALPDACAELTDVTQRRDSQFVTVDHAVISSITFDGTTLVEAGSLDIPVDLYTCPAEDRRGGGGGGDQGCYRAAYRSVQMSADGSMAMASGFVNPYDQDTFDALPAMGFVTSFSVDPSTFALTEQTRLDLDGNARSVLFVETP